MGIKGIYKEIGAGARIAFLRLAVDSVEKRGRPLRLAIDISIWQFQVQAARGGSNPAVRTLFYRLVRLLGMPVQPIFVFDGPNKPLFKRNKRSAGPGDTVAAAMAKRMIRMFGFYIHDAPGEAEAECALLQQRGVVDAVLSEDVDTLMFGCTRTLRNWSAATSTSSGKGNSSATVTHVTMFETERHLPTATGEAVDPAVVPEAVLRSRETGLDREGMVLVALMSGGDYIPEGVPGCGVKLACEAAKAGFGRSLCRIKRSDTAAFVQWRADLQHELRTNESKFFRTCHHKLVIPDEFPSLDVLRYYTHPVVSPSDVVERVRAELAVHNTPGTAYASSVGLGGRTAVNIKPIDILGLRDFVAETFDWTYRGGAIKFVRVLAPGLLARMLLLKWSSDYGKLDDGDEGLDGEVVTEDTELFPRLVEGISRQRTHASTDDTPELRVSFVPLTVVGIDLSRELEDPEATFGRDGIALNSDDDFDEPPPTAATQMPMTSLTVASARGMAAAAPYDPAVAKVAWIPRSIVEIGAPGALGEWDQKQQRVKKPAAKSKAGDGAKTASSRGRKPGSATALKSNMPAGALDRFVSITKNVSDARPAAAKEASQSFSASQATFKPVPNYFGDLSSDEEANDTTKHGTIPPTPSAGHVSPATQQPRRTGGNPWALTGSKNLPRVKKSSASSGQQAKETHSLTPVKQSTRKRALVVTPIASKTQPAVISLLSSDPIPATVDIQTSPIESSLPPTTSFSSLTWSPTPLPRDAQRASALQDNNSSSPNPRRRHAPLSSTAIAGSQLTRTKGVITSSPQKQTSIRSFMSSQAQTSQSPTLPQHKKSMTILLSDDEDGTALSANNIDNSDPFSSSPPIFSSRSGKAMSQALVRGQNDKASGAPTDSVVGKRTKISKKPIPPKTKTRFVPRTSAVGYFREENEVEGDGASLAEGQDQNNGRRGWRLSEIGVVDLTGDGV
ncbi:flap structure-specific endonuclease [Ophiostoma piceae UAMH 11346]|uniref:Flap structure-specific endonuclease n=1 Tax=Ophiostoma piceae (strain UAMH 11346) TaxID=1262450 RepID=S3BTI1_OPHP1|nr:flap structure-specific endonuclease [Ophiostoma piceae UAMH 11346]